MLRSIQQTLLHAIAEYLGVTEESLDIRYVRDRDPIDGWRQYAVRATDKEVGGTMDFLVPLIAVFHDVDVDSISEVSFASWPPRPTEDFIRPMGAR